ncbi:MAG: hypothetical protein MI742_12385 [Desulfobacterales bacterium]|nr:hypothetical protein [Desulfobacterales bacterium]
MKKIFMGACLALMLCGSAWGAGPVTVSTGGALIYDPFDQEAGEAVKLEVTTEVLPNVALELTGLISGRFDLDNNLSEEETAVSVVALGGKFMSDSQKETRGYLSLGVGAMVLNADDDALADERRSGAVARFGIGIEHDFSRVWALRLGAGYSQGVGGTEEISFFDASLSISAAAF